VLTGVVTTLLGPIIPALSQKWSLNDEQAGYLFTAQFAGSMTGVALSGRLTLRLGYIRLLAVGFALMCAGIAGLGVSAYAPGIASVLCYGVGLGITIPTANLLVADANPGRRAASLNLLNFFWAAGAVISPPAIAFAAKNGETTAALGGLALSLALVAFLLIPMSSVSLAGRLPATEQSTQPAGPNWRSPFVPLIGAMVFLYVGTENAIAGWVGSHAMRLEASAHTLWSLAPSTFWGALLLGRVTAPAGLRRVREERLVLMGLVAASCGACVLLLSTTTTGVLIGVTLAGAGLASVFPTTIALLPRCFGEMAPRIAGLVFALAGLGGATLPWLVGWVSTRFGGLRTGLGVPLVTILAMIALQVTIIFALSRQRR